MKKYTQYKLYLKIRSPTCLNMHKYLVLTKFILVNNYIPKKKKIKSNQMFIIDIDSNLSLLKNIKIIK